MFIMIFFVCTWDQEIPNIDYLYWRFADTWQWSHDHAIVDGKRQQGNHKEDGLDFTEDNICL